MEYFKQDIKYLPGVGPKRAELLNKELGIYTFEDLITYYPYKYIDRSKFYKTSEIESHLAHVQLAGKISHFRLEGGRSKRRLVADFEDEEGTISLVWFHGIKWIRDAITPERKYIVFGKPNFYQGNINIIHPEIEDAEAYQSKPSASLHGLYNTTEKLKKSSIHSRTIQKLMVNLFKNMKGAIPETLPDYLMDRLQLTSRDAAMKNIHFPTDNERLSRASYRLKFEELFFIQLNLLRQKIRRARMPGFIFGKVGNYVNDFYKQHLHFDLTDAQKRVIKEIRNDLGSGKQMNRLLQGDVGSGKTLVALMTMLIALDNRFQACLMAPTEILASQHYQTISKFLSRQDIHISLLTGSTKTAERKAIHEALKSGSLQILVGTHALIEETVKFSNLGLVVIDEQHRFGVAQRARLWKKNVQPPHVMVMTATPIPRTLAMTLYGDLDVSVIDEMPPGRIPIKTLHFRDSQRNRVFGFMRRQIEAGQQIFVVYPLIKESEKMDYKDLEDGYESISRAFPPPKYAVSVVHGRMKTEEKDISMKHFIEGRTHIMVATTVIEVGVDIPNASVMVIESAERFGLSQLHQLRGRVGRGNEQSYCILMSGDALSSDARKRLQTMVQTIDGFEIAEVDLKLRGPGDLEGTQQSGLAFQLKIANLGKDGQILQYARMEAEKILDADPELSHEAHHRLKIQLRKMASEKVSWREIS
jgi:ATP-dependent DNA helicase RecG